MPVSMPASELRLWPAVAVVGGFAALGGVVPFLFPREMTHFVAQMGSLVLGPVCLLLWWLVGSRAAGWLRWVPVLLFQAAAAALIFVVYPDKPQMVLFFGMPFVALLWFGFLVVGRVSGWPVHVAGVGAAILAGWAAFGTVRIDQTDADVYPELRWFWTPTAEERFLAERSGATAAPAVAGAPVTVGSGDWPAFRGPNRDSKLIGVTVKTDWSANPPKQLWKRRIGPGWGTFSAAGGRLFTQYQADAKECVACLDAGTGQTVWEHAEEARFTEAIAGAGPRATPTVQDGKLYAMGATGLLLCLDAATGQPVWKTDIKQGTGGIVPQWGYSSSPLVVGGLVIVYAGGPDGKGTAAFKASDGSLAWAAGKATHSYSSAQLATFGGVEQVLMVSDWGVESFRPADGAILWGYEWVNPGGNRVCQPAVLPDGLLIGTGAGKDLSTRRLKVTKGDDGKFAVEQVWSTRKLKPYFNDGVIHAGYFYGFDDSALVCIDLADGSLKWNAGKLYGHGQVLLLADPGLLLVQAVDGKAVLVRAAPDEYDEVAKFPALSGKTWNHPIVANGRLYVRNGQEAAGYQLGE